MVWSWTEDICRSCNGSSDVANETDGQLYIIVMTLTYSFHKLVLCQCQYGVFIVIRFVLEKKLRTNSDCDVLQISQRNPGSRLLAAHHWSRIANSEMTSTPQRFHWTHFCFLSFDLTFHCVPDTENLRADKIVCFTPVQHEIKTAPIMFPSNSLWTQSIGKY